MKYELVNPSDMIFFEAEDDRIAFVAALAVGNGYAAKRTDNGEIAIGFYLFGINDEAFKNELGQSMDDFVKQEASRLSAALASFCYQSERTSMNRIVDRAHSLARSLIKPAEAVKP